MASNMASASYYAEERLLYKEEYDLKVTDDKSLKVMKKLCNHYKVPFPRVRFWGNNDSGSACGSNIRLSHNPSLGLIMHEFCHYAKRSICDIEHLTLENQGTNHHGTRFQSCLNFVNQYALTKNYWKNMLEKSGVTNEPEETFDDIIAEGIHRVINVVDEKKEEIVRVEQKIEGYRKRLQYFTKLYGTKIKKANRSLAAHKRALKKIVNMVLTSDKQCAIVGDNN